MKKSRHFTTKYTKTENKIKLLNQQFSKIPVGNFLGVGVAASAIRGFRLQNFQRCHLEFCSNGEDQADFVGWKLLMA